MTDPLDVSGRWNGVFNYPRGLPPSGFRAELRDHAGAISGESNERSDQGPDRGTSIKALISGTRTGEAIRFTKRYDALSRADYAVNYDGTISSDGDEIIGRWSIPGIWEGTFLMVRQAGRASAKERRVAETIDR